MGWSRQKRRQASIPHREAGHDRGAGGGRFAAEGHEIASAIEYEIERKLGEGNATAHIEPCTDAGCGRCARGEGG